MNKKTLAWFGLLYMTAFVAVVLAAAANGFVTTRPDTRFGDQQSAPGSDFILAQKFTAPGTGTKAISEVGLFAASNPAGSHLRMALFTDDSANNRPETIISNSYTDEVAPGNSMGIAYFNYGTKPLVEGGQSYWIAIIAENGIVISKFNSTNSAAYEDTVTYPTFLSGDQWHSSDLSSPRDMSFYAIYEDAATTTTTTAASTTTSTSTTSSTAAGATTSTLRRGRMLTMGVG